MPETLAADGGRLAVAQATFQRLLVGTAAALLLREHAAATRRALAPGTNYLYIYIPHLLYRFQKNSTP